MKITVADLGVGNLFSLRRALEACGATVEIQPRPSGWLEAPVLVLPGVGAFGAGAKAIAQVRDQLRDRITKGGPTLGVCLGFQLFFDGGDEAPGARGLGVIPGNVPRFKPQPGLKVPHMGWTRVDIRPDPLWNGIPDGSHFYFVHSYYPEPREGKVLGTATHGTTFAAVVRQGRAVGAQFHPEKSGTPGLRLLANWVKEAEAQR